MTPENPERLWAFTQKRHIQRVVAFGASEDAAGAHAVEESFAASCDPLLRQSAVAEYVRADVAAAETAEAARVAEEKIAAERRRVAALRESLHVIVMRSLAATSDPNVDVMAYEVADHALTLDGCMAEEADRG